MACGQDHPLVYQAITSHEFAHSVEGITSPPDPDPNVMPNYGQLNPPLWPAPSGQTVEPISHLAAQVAWSDTLHQMLSLTTCL